jgi:hypothetical protein
MNAMPTSPHLLQGSYLHFKEPLPRLPKRSHLQTTNGHCHSSALLTRRQRRAVSGCRRFPGATPDQARGRRASSDKTGAPSGADGSKRPCCDRRCATSSGEHRPVPAELGTRAARDHQTGLERFPHHVSSRHSFHPRAKRDILGPTIPSQQRCECSKDFPRTQRTAS